MLFNSYGFLLLFFPIVVVGLVVADRLSRFGGASKQTKIWVLVASIVFYAAWRVQYAPLLLASIAVNYLIGKRLVAEIESPHPNRRSCRLWLISGIALNVGVLVYFKYTGFILDLYRAAVGQAPLHLSLALPLGISFYTFTAIAFLVDAAAGKVGRFRAIDLALFVSYFPHLIAGPLVRQNVLLQQLRPLRPFKVDWRSVAVGMSLFTAGLAKKILIADRVAGPANRLFNAPADLLAAPGGAWYGVIAYSLQIYFDFSGYSDMALGLSYVLGIRLPMNFNSPYQARNIIDFWRRWHITLSEFLRDYVYVPLGGSRSGGPRRFLNFLVTMVIGGLWHGAGFTFLVWGLIHGLYLSVNHAWRTLFPPAARPWAGLPQGIRSAVAQTLTLLCVMVAWVAFRANDLTTAKLIWRRMADIPSVIGAVFNGEMARMAMSLSALSFFAVILGAALALFAPNTAHLFRDFDPVTASSKSLVAPALEPLFGKGLRFRPSNTMAAITALVFLTCLVMLAAPREFIYFQF